MAAGPTTKLLPSAIIVTSKLKTLTAEVRRDNAASVRALRALHSAANLTSLHLELFFEQSLALPPENVVRELVWCLPSSLQELDLLGLSVPTSIPRPLVKALWLRVPLLESVVLEGASIQPMLRGLLDVGAKVMSALEHVWFESVGPAIFVWEIEADPLPPLLRRF